jgi:putative zinc finger/helix-turn-helix YgiT family protein
MHKHTQNYPYTECGLQNIVLKNITVYRCPSCGSQIPEIVAMAALHRCIMMSVLRKNTLLDGEEIKFLRKMAGLKAAELAKLMSTTPSTLSKWENNARPIGKSFDRVLRLICYSGMLERLLKLRDADLINQTAQAARKSPMLDVRELLKKIDGKKQATKKIVTIDPRKLSEFSGLEVETEVLQ